MNRTRVQLQEDQPGDREHQAGQGKHVDEPAPRRPGVAALVEIVGIGDPAAVGAFRRHLARCRVHAQPAVAAGSRQRQVDFLRCPLRFAQARAHAHAQAQEFAQRHRQRCRSGLRLRKRRQLGAQRLGQGIVLRHRHGRGRNLRGVVEGDARHREQQQSRQAQRRADPVPQVQRAQPPGALAGGARYGRSGRRRCDHRG